MNFPRSNWKVVINKTYVNSAYNYHDKTLKEVFSLCLKLLPDNHSQQKKPPPCSNPTKQAALRDLRQCGFPPSEFERIFTKQFCVANLRGCEQQFWRNCPRACYSQTSGYTARSTGCRGVCKEGMIYF